MSVLSDCVFLFLFRNVFLCVSCRYYYIKADEPFVRVTERRWGRGVTSLPPPTQQLLMNVAHLLIPTHFAVVFLCVVCGFLGSKTQRTRACQMTFQFKHKFSIKSTLPRRRQTFRENYFSFYLSFFFFSLARGYISAFFLSFCVFPTNSFLIICVK